jgi:hypothetical protein
MANTFFPMSLRVRINKDENVVLPTPPFPLMASFIGCPSCKSADADFVVYRFEFMV